jgi:HSP20 family protein
MASNLDPFRDFERFFNQVLRTPNTMSMPMDLHQDGDTFVARIDLPGVDPSTIDVDVEDRTLTVRAERRSESTTEGRRWLTRERSVGTYARQLSLGQGLAVDQIEADYQDGVLTLTIPVAEEAKARKIQVKHSGEAQEIEGTTAEEQEQEQEQAISGS